MYGQTENKDTHNRREKVRTTVERISNQRGLRAGRDMTSAFEWRGKKEEKDLDLPRI